MSDRLYLAAAFGRREEVAAYAGAFEVFGWQVVSRWLERDFQLPGSAVKVYASDPRWVARIEELAALDAEDVARCDMLVAFTSTDVSGEASGGRHVEFGLAMALGKRLMVVGEPENIFHLAPGVIRVPDIDAALGVLSGRVWRR